MKVGDLVRYHVEIREWSQDFIEYMEGLGVIIFIGYDGGNDYVDVVTMQGNHETFHKEDITVL